MKRFHVPLTLFPATVSIVVQIIAVLVATSFRPTAVRSSSIFIGVFIFAVIMTFISALCLIFDLTKRSSPNIQEKEDMSLTELSWEREIKFELRRVIYEIKKARSIIKEYDSLEITEDASIDTNEIIHTAHVTSRTALRLLSAKIEEQILVRLQEAELQPQTNYVLSHEALDEAEEKGLIPLEMISAFRSFVSMRSNIAHDADFEVDEDTILSLISIGIELLKIISEKSSKDSGLASSDIT